MGRRTLTVTKFAPPLSPPSAAGPAAPPLEPSPPLPPGAGAAGFWPGGTGVPAGAFAAPMP